jgi:hypothetical protein
MNQGYSSEEEDGVASSTNDVFGVNQLHSTKKVRVEEQPPSIIPHAAPDVLAEVSGRLWSLSC